MSEEVVDHKISFWRHSGYADQNTLNGTLHIVGCGAVGSNVAAIAARMGFSRFDLWDFDKVADYNCPNQYFFEHQIGMPKVEALKEQLLRINSSIEVAIHDGPLLKESQAEWSGPMILAPDSMKARTSLIELAAENPTIDGVFEVRLGWEFGNIYYVDNTNSDSVEMFRQTLCKDEDLPEGPCNKKICLTLVNLFATRVVKYLVYMYASRQQGKEWKLPFRTYIEDPDWDPYLILD